MIPTKYNSIDQDKVFPSSNGIAIRIDHVVALIYVGQEGSAFEMAKCKSSPLFQKYKPIISTCDGEDYEICHICGDNNHVFVINLENGRHIITLPFTKEKATRVKVDSGIKVRD
jgi:hypothetical protein